MIYKLSKALKNGDIVTLHGRKFIKCSGKRRIMGIYQAPDRKHYILLNGGEKVVDTPEGIQTFGMSMVR